MIRLGAILAVLALSVTLVSTARAQTVPEAARANVSLAVDLCLRHLTNEGAGLAAYRAAGFDESAGQFGTAFSAPADTAVSEYRSGVCYVTSRHLGASEAAQLIAGVVQTQFPGAMSPSQAYNNECAHFLLRGLVSYAPITMTIGHIGSALSNPCIQDGTTRITITVVG